MIKVSKKDEKLVWLEADSVPYNTQLIVDAGCQALVVMDGAIVKYREGEEILLNPKSFLKKSNVSNWAVYGISNKKLFNLYWGLPYSDYTDKSLNGAVIGVRARGECKVVVGDAKKLFATLFSNSIVLDEETISDKMRDEIISHANSALASIASTSAGYSEIKSNQEELGGKILSKLEDLLERYGIRMESCNVSALEFDQRLNEFISLINKGIQEGYRSIVVDEQTKQGGMAAGMLNKFRNKKDDDDNKKEEK